MSALWPARAPNRHQLLAKRAVVGSTWSECASTNAPGRVRAEMRRGAPFARQPVGVVNHGALDMFPTRGHLNSTSLRSAGRPPLCQSRRAEWSCRAWSRSVLCGDVSRRVARCQTHRVQICADSSCLLGVSSVMRRRRALQSPVS